MQNNKHGGNSVDLQIFCVSCGKPINVHTALCHMECCFAKVPDDEVCGCPLVHNVFEVTDDFCHLPKGLCKLHYCWEKLR
ncbi:hypothetical protein R6Z07F_020014 [Ovis aries]